MFTGLAAPRGSLLGMAGFDDPTQWPVADVNYVPPTYTIGASAQGPAYTMSTNTASNVYNAAQVLRQPIVKK